MEIINDDYDPPDTFHKPGLLQRGPLLISRTLGALSLLALLALKGFADESAAPSPTHIIQAQDTNALETLRAILRIEGQLRADQLATEQNGKEAREAGARNAEVLARGMQTIQEAFSAQQQALSERNVRELEAMQGFNRVMLRVGGAFTAVASLVLIVVFYFQWRISKAWAAIWKEWSGSRIFTGGSTIAAVGPGDSREIDASPVNGSSTRLQRAMGQLETRVQQLEQSTSQAAGGDGLAGTSAENGDTPGESGLVNGTGDTNPATGNGQAKIGALLAQGQALLKANDWEGALKYFDEVLGIEPRHSQALVKKGAALERLKRLDEAFACYDQAIAADDSLAVAYLHKGGLCSRLERFKEALECYEMALRTHTEWDRSSH